MKIEEKTTDAGRVIEVEFELAAPVEDVWRALTDAEWLTNWFPPEARVNPGVGGSIWSSWGEGQQWETPITHWAENEHLRVVWMPATPEAEADEAKANGRFMPVDLAVDYHLEGRGGSTVLRLVHSGFGTNEAWGSQYDGTKRGWAMELRGLVHYLERHKGEKREIVHVKHVLASPDFQAAWARVFGDEGLLASGTLDGLAAGDAYRFVTSDGDVLSGTVRLLNAPQDLVATVNEYADALLRVRIDMACMTQPDPEVNLFLSTYGVGEEEREGLAVRWSAMLGRLFGAHVPAS